MTKIGDVAKGIEIFFCGFFLYVAIVQAITGQTAIAIFMLAGSLIPFSMVLNSYLRARKTRKTALIRL